MEELLDAAPCGFVTIADDGTIVEVNRTLADMLGFTRHDLLGWHVDKMLPAGGRIFYQTYVFPLLKVQGQVEEIYIALRTSDGRDIPVLLNAVRRDRAGRFVSDCVCVRMIQRHEYEAQLLHARRLAEESSEAKAKFLSMMSHDLRTPLTTIYGNAELLSYESLNAEQQEALAAIREACRAQMTMVNDILEFASLDSGRVHVQPRAVPVAEAIGRAEALMRVQMSDAGLEFVVRGCAGDAAVLADPDRLQQILLNLLTNAVKFTPPGGEVSLLCEVAEERIRFRVRDTGVGIPAEDLPRIFSPFVQLGTAPPTAPGAFSRGVGLGLAISRDLARAMNGDVSVESTAGAGSTFTVELPVAVTTTAAS
jgi:PAS domain S-box-containing protein